MRSSKRTFSAGSIMIMRSTDQLKDGGTIPASALQFSACTIGGVSRFIKKHHYSHTHPGGIDFAFAATCGFELVGACAFGFIAGNAKAMCVCDGVDDPRRYRELMRLVLLDEVAKNTESQFIGFCLRWLKRNTDLAAIVSFADPKFGHVGTVYKASNWIYTGLQKQDRDRIILKQNGLMGEFEQEVHPKQIYNWFGSSSTKVLGAHRTEPREPKHRYVYLLRHGLRCKYELKPFPLRPDA